MLLCVDELNAPRESGDHLMVYFAQSDRCELVVEAAGRLPDMAAAATFAVAYSRSADRMPRREHEASEASGSDDGDSGDDEEAIANRELKKMLPIAAYLARVAMVGPMPQRVQSSQIRKNHIIPLS